VWDTSGFYFHDAAVQTNGVDDPASSGTIRASSLPATSGTSVARRWAARAGSQQPVGHFAGEAAAPGNRVRAQFHAEFLNCVQSGRVRQSEHRSRSSDFGKVTSQNNLRATIQVALKLIF